MPWTLTNDLDAYAAAVAGLVAAEPERHTVLATVLANLIKHGPRVYGEHDPVLGWWADEPSGPVLGAMLQTPPHPLHLTALPPEAVAPLAAALTVNGPGYSIPGYSISGISGNEETAGAFAGAWSAVTGERFGVRMRQRLYRLDRLIPPDPAPAGAARVAADADESVVRAYDEAFGIETDQHGRSDSLMLDKLRAGRFVLWEVAGEPAAMASVTETIAGVARVGQVYTPPDRRGRGYGSAVTHAASALVIDRGASSVVLFTDLANPTSNSIYGKIGYRPVEDRVLLALAR
jgi:GNAT superfamily N-acetyltransferase